jgi:hypothetical protein
MDTLPFKQKIVAPRGCLGQETPHIRPFYAGTEDDLGRSGGAEQIDPGVPSAGDMDMGRFVIERVDDEPEAERAMDDHHGLI